LDGDNFFICWDPDLIPKEDCEPHIIEDIKEAKKGDTDPKKT
jgi:RNA-dependent RNA polymerase